GDGTCRPRSRRSVFYQRPPPRLPPPPPPGPPRRAPPPPPPPPMRGSCGRASLTVNVRPPSCVPFSALMAFCASSALDISTKPKPRDCPVNLSVTTFADSTVPCVANSSFNSASVVEYGIPPT